MKDEEVKFVVGDRFASLNAGEEGTIARLCSDSDVIYVRWDKDASQEMVKIVNLRRIKDGHNKT